MTTEQCEKCNSWTCHFHPNNNYWKENPRIFTGDCKDHRMARQATLNKTVSDKIEEIQKEVNDDRTQH